MDYVGEIKQGNKLVFEEVYYRYHERFYFYVLKNTRSEDIAEEVVQMSFIKIWEKRTDLSNSFPIEVQIARVARSIMIDILRKKASERKALETIKENANTVIAGDTAAGKELIIKVSEAIETLPPECRKIFILSREEGLTYTEIANQLSISPKTVENQISKALKAVRKAVALAYILSF
ncbi:MAG: RNA polymerase sigma-70 factor [Bacteroidota bacterium]|nr:RNA polymerase sigma-70 factor [Bacteroidota bacterium]